MMTMKMAMTCVMAGSAVALAPAALAQHDEHAAAAPRSAESGSAAPINAMCPIGKEPIVGSAGTVQYKGHAIGLCCPSCAKEFLALDEKTKDAFVARALATGKPQIKTAAEDAGPADGQMTWTDPYPLETCPVSGQKLGSMGEPIVKQYDGREVRFCCSGCIDKFEADQAGYWAKIDQQIVEDQLPYYPLTTCVVSGEPLTEGGQDIANDFVYGNRLVRLCCKMCERSLKANPSKYIGKLDEATIAAQRADYPLETCIVGGGTLGSMGEPAEAVIAGRLMRFCCGGCEPKARANPTKYLQMIDDAWRAKGGFTNTGKEANAKRDKGEHADGHGHDGHEGHGAHDHGH